MRRSFLIVFFILCFPLVILSQPGIKVSCADSWGPGRYNLVTVEISFGTNDGFARFTQDFPVGFEIIRDKITEADFAFTSNQLNIVWMKIPGVKSAGFSYFIKPDNSMKGTIDMNARIVIISGGTMKETVSIKEIPVTIGGINGLIPEELEEKSGKTIVTNVTNSELQKKDGKSAGIVFRVQVSSSSTQETEAAVKEKLGLDKGTRITTVKAGKIYRYQAGEYTDYESAEKLQKTLVSKGIKDAFIVAYKEWTQVSLEEAREAAGKNR